MPPAALSARARELEDENARLREELSRLSAAPMPRLEAADLEPAAKGGGGLAKTPTPRDTPRDFDGAVQADEKHAKIMEHQLLRLQKRVKELEIANKELEMTNSELSEFAQGGEMFQQLQVCSAPQRHRHSGRASRSWPCAAAMATAVCVRCAFAFGFGFAAAAAAPTGSCMLCVVCCIVVRGVGLYAAISDLVILRPQREETALRCVAPTDYRAGLGAAGGKARRKGAEGVPRLGVEDRQGGQAVRAAAVLPGTTRP